MLSRLATCCPALEDLRVALDGGEHLSVLTRLTALTSLVSGINCSQWQHITASARHVAALTHLRALDLWLMIAPPRQETHVAHAWTRLQPLTGLTQLTSCKLANWLATRFTHCRSLGTWSFCNKVRLADRCLEHCAVVARVSKCVSCLTTWASLRMRWA